MPGFTPGNSKSSQNKWKPQINLFEIEYKYRCRIMDGKLFEPLTSRGSAVRSRQLPQNTKKGFKQLKPFLFYCIAFKCSVGLEHPDL